MTDILSLMPEELKQQISDLGLPAYRSKQISEWLTRGCRDFSEMTNLPKTLREVLQEHFELYAPKMLRQQISREDGTKKLLWGLVDGNSVETVFMRYHYGNSVCTSTSATPFAFPARSAAVRVAASVRQPSADWSETLRREK